jgi:hypothetical protein
MTDRNRRLHGVDRAENPDKFKKYYRGGGEGMESVSRDTSVWDIVVFEREELGNTEDSIRPLFPAALLKLIPAARTQWLARTKKGAQYYGRVTAMTYNDPVELVEDNQDGCIVIERAAFNHYFDYWYKMPDDDDRTENPEGGVRIPAYLRTPKLKPYIEQGLITQEIVDLYEQAHKEARVSAQNQINIFGLRELRLKMIKVGNLEAAAKIKAEAELAEENGYDYRRELVSTARQLESVINKKIGGAGNPLLKFPHWRGTTSAGYVGDGYYYHDAFAKNITDNYLKTLRNKT